MTGSSRREREGLTMARYPKPAEGSWTRHYPHLGTEPVSYEDSVSPEWYELEKRGDLQAGLAQGRAGRADPAHRQLLHQGDRRRRTRRSSSCATARTCGPSTTSAGTAATSSSGTTSPARRRAARPGSSSASTTGGATGLDGACTFAQQEGEFFDLDKADYGLVPVHCDIFAGFIFVNFAPAAEPVVARVPRPDAARD